MSRFIVRWKADPKLCLLFEKRWDERLVRRVESFSWVVDPKGEDATKYLTSDDALSAFDRAQCGPRENCEVEEV